MTRCNARAWLDLVAMPGCWSGACGRRSVATSGPVRRTRPPRTPSRRSGRLGNRGRKPSGAAAPGALLTAQDVLEKMAAAYRNASSYEDSATAGASTGAGAARNRHAGRLFQWPSSGPTSCAWSSIRARSSATARSGMPFATPFPAGRPAGGPGEAQADRCCKPTTLLYPVLNKVSPVPSPQFLLLRRKSR